MKEQVITFETAKLAKEKGFNLNYPIECYNEDGSICLHYNAFSERITGKPRPEVLYSAPTQSLLQKWLREVHKIIVEVNYTDCEFWQWVIFCKHLEVYYCGTNETDNVDLNREEALEIGLKEALKLINI